MSGSLDPLIERQGANDCLVVTCEGRSTWYSSGNAIHVADPVQLRHEVYFDLVPRVQDRRLLAFGCPTGWSSNAMGPISK